MAVYLMISVSHFASRFELTSSYYMYILPYYILPYTFHILHPLPDDYSTYLCIHVFHSKNMFVYKYKSYMPEIRAAKLSLYKVYTTSDVKNKIISFT